MKALIKTLCVIGIIVGTLAAVKLAMELFSTKFKKYYIVEKA